MKSRIIVLAIKVLKRYFTTFSDRHVALADKELKAHFHVLLEKQNCLEEFLSIQNRTHFL